MKKLLPSLCFLTILASLAACNDTTNSVTPAAKKDVQETMEQASTEMINQANDDIAKKADAPKDGKRPPGGFKQKSVSNKDFVGITTSAGKVTGLFPIKNTGVSTQGIADAANDFLSSLTGEQAKKLRFAIDDDEWLKWSNVDNGIYQRAGVSLKEMTDKQKEKAFALMSASLSAKGLHQSKDIMKTDQTLKELNNGDSRYDEELYFFTVMGEPSATEPWGWQIDGHHLVVNYFVLGDQVVLSPAFMGGEPVRTTTGKHKGNVILQEEQDLGLAFMQSLDAEQQTQATIDDPRRGRFKSGAGEDNLVLDYEGIPVKTLSNMQQEKLLAVVSEYINNLPQGHAQVKLDEFKAHLDDTWFAWIGETSDDAVFYYRIHSPVLLIEFDHQGYVGVPHDRSKRGEATRDHIHTMIRTPNGNDYGKDLLGQHLRKHHSHD